MRRKVVFLIIGILIGAIITTAGFLIYNKSITNNLSQSQMIEPNENGQMGEPPAKPDGENGSMLGQDVNNADITYTASKEIIKDSKIESGEYLSEEADENALLINVNIDVAISNIEINKTGDSFITSLEDTDTTYSNIDFNGYKLYVNGIAIN